VWIRRRITSSRRFDEAFSLIGVVVLVEICDENVGSFSREGQRYRTANAGVSAG
jgi:hypothetical protein